MKRKIYISGSKATFQNYQDAVERAGGIAVFSGDALDCAGLLLPGGGDLEPWRYGQENTACINMDPARDAAEMELLRQFTECGKPVLGICRGLQSINVFFGGTLIQDLPGHRQYAGIDRLHRVQTERGAFGGLYSSCCVNSAHHQAVDALGSGLRAVQWAPDGVVEALCHQTLPVWAVQWHPERIQGRSQTAGAADGARLFQAFLQLCGQKKWT